MIVLDRKSYPSVGRAMNIGIGLPATIPGTSSSLVLDWAKRADSGPFSSLGIIDRLVYPNYEPLVTLAAAAAVTERVRLMITVLIAPLRQAGVLVRCVKQVCWRSRRPQSMRCREDALPWGSAWELEKTISAQPPLPFATEAAGSRSSFSSRSASGPV